jgi:diguanylate cyclase (GGDEF)-like protein
MADGRTQATTADSASLDRGHPRVNDTRWITGTVALLAIAVFAISGSQVVPALLPSNAGAELDPRHVTAFLLNIALVLFAWRRSEQLKTTFAQRDAAERRAYDLAYYDEVTGLLNRRHLKQVLADPGPANSRASALILIDLDNFKKINDVYGHAVGDELLVVTAQRLQAACPADAVCVRLGGDEFAVLLRGPSARKELPVQLAERLLEELNKPIKLGRTETAVGVSIGIAALDKPSGDSNWLLKRADIAMYQAKKLGRNCCVPFDAAMELELERRSALEGEMRKGIEAGEFVPYFQPIVDLPNGAVRGFEVLARWQHPTRGLLEPPEFLEIAETTGMISELSFGVMHEALAIAAKWPSRYTIAVNLSPVQFNDPLVAARVMRVLAATGFPPGRLEVEVMEKSLLDDHSSALAALTSLRNSGVSVVVDDFGIGYASLTQLESLPFDRMKIDRNFMATLQDDNQCGAFVRAISAIGKGLKVPITAEGVESASVQAQLAELGCADAQGWLFSKALSAEQVRLGLFSEAPTEVADAPDSIERGAAA